MLTASYKKHKLLFKNPSGTSRGVLTEKDSWFIVINDLEKPGLIGIGECSLLNHLSIDYLPDYEAKISFICNNINTNGTELFREIEAFPSIKFGLESALLDLEKGGKRCLFESGFYIQGEGIPINGLIWMGSTDNMKKQLKDKVDKGFGCIKIKIGSLDFNEELDFLRFLRKEYGYGIELRLDANGAFLPADAAEKLNRLSEYRIHSIEQPIRQGQITEMARICRTSPIPVALDEELIGIAEAKQEELLQLIRPQYIILKPSLLGGFAASDKWIALAEKMNMGWWITSALESNIGLNAIAQYASSKNPRIPQGLGTGALFTNNIPSPLEVIGEQLFYLHEKPWQTESIVHV